MDQNWLLNLEQNTALIVPTRSLANTLNEQIAQHHIAQGRKVWEAPNILIWRDYLKQLWQLNKQALDAKYLITAQQSTLMWNKVIESSRREEQALMLLNVQQTARAVQQSWMLMYDWQVSKGAIEQDHVADTQQFIQWLDDYQSLLNKRGMVDEPLLIDALCNTQASLLFPYQKLIIYAFDLINVTQQKINELAISQGVAIEEKAVPSRQSVCEYKVYEDSKSEIRGAFYQARKLIEQDNQRSINIVIHDLQDKQSQVQELAREVFYPAESPLHVQQNSTVYRFSLGQRLSEWAAVETAISVIGLLKNKTTNSDLSFILRNQFLSFSAKYRAECRVFDRWLKRQRMRNIMFDKLPELYQQCQASMEEQGKALETQGLLQGLEQLVSQRQQLVDQLVQAKQQSNFAALSFTEWVNIYSDWLESWGWSTKTVGNDLNTVQHQLLKRWQALLEEFAGLATVQRQVGMNKALELIQQMARDAMFIPKAVASPILVSSILEAVGRPADFCFVLGMNDSFPPPPKNDAFIAQRLLASAGHPDMSADSSFVQAKAVMQNLLDSMGDTVISYAKHSEQDVDITNQSSALFRNKSFQQGLLPSGYKSKTHELQAYTDIQGPAWPDASKAKGGSKIFENQSNCAFKAFVTHQLGFQTEEEAEFGLDHLDRGNIVHHMLDLIWLELQTQRVLIEKTDQQLDDIINNVIERTFTEFDENLQADKATLLHHEKPRLYKLLKGWLDLEAKRPESFAVIEREERRVGEIAGIQFSYIVDRLDMTDDGRTFVVDYKTGNVNRKDWTDESIKSPQMPLYAVALSKAKNKPVSGIAYGSVRQDEHKFIELSEQGVFRKASKRTENDEVLWHQSCQQWPAIFDQLATEFLSGKAEVNPIDESTCQYCDLHSVCRISQLKTQTESQEPGQEDNHD